MNTRIDGASCQIIPDDLYTSGEPSLNRLAAAAGDRFDVWQRQINRIILAKSADGFWSARNAVLSIPRQTGKTYDIGWVAIHRAARTPGMRIVWTAQHFSVIKDTFESLCAIVLRPEMSGLVDPDHGISLAAGKEEIRFRNGSRIFFRARERGALRGVKKIALLVIDEAQHLSDSAMASMLPTQNRAWNPQTIYMGTPPGPRDNGEAFTRLRDKTRAGRTHSTLYVEFTADRDADPLDRQQWRKANPSYPAHTSDESIANLWENLTGDDFRREALGIWDEHALSQAIDRRQWEEATIDKRRPGGVMSFGIDMNPPRTRLTIGACMRYDDNTAHIELANTGTPTKTAPCGPSTSSTRSGNKPPRSSSTGKAPPPRSCPTSPRPASPSPSPPPPTWAAPAAASRTCSETAPSPTCPKTANNHSGKPPTKPPHAPSAKTDSSDGTDPTTTPTSAHSTPSPSPSTGP